MPKISINKMINTNIYVNNVNFLGKAEEVELPDVKYNFEEHKALGLFGSPEFFKGVDKMEAKIKWNSVYSDVIREFSNPLKPVNITIKGHIDNYSSLGVQGSESVTAYIVGKPKEGPSFKTKAKENVDTSNTLAVDYYKLVINNVERYEIDILNNIFKVDGVDIMAKYHQNTGT